MVISSSTTVLVVAAHPDDEVLGCGGTIAKHANSGDDVHILIAAEGCTSRLATRDLSLASQELSALNNASIKSAQILGAKSIDFLQQPDNRLDSIDRLELIKKVEKYVHLFKPSIVYTHHAGDVNVDHRLLHEAVITACRPTPTNTVLRLLSYEVLSSTEWQTPGSASVFQPNWFNDIEPYYEKKYAALKAYEMEMRPWPHPRSFDTVKYLALLRGSQVGLNYAEAFCLLRSIQ